MPELNGRNGTITTASGKVDYFVRRDGRGWRAWRSDHANFHVRGRTHYEALGKLMLYFASEGDLVQPASIQVRGHDGNRLLPCPIRERPATPNDITEGPDWLDR